MTRKIPSDAFTCYASLGPARSYRAVAEKFGVTKRTVTRVATKERWCERIEKMEREARIKAEEKARESLEAMHERHLKALKVIQGKALEALRSMSISSAMHAVRALDLAIKQERTIRGEPTDRTAVSVEETIRQEYARWLGPEDDDGEGDDEFDDEDESDS